jgi:hypothetical protein
MSRPAPKIRLSTEEKEILLRWMRSSKTELRLVERARVILLASSGLSGRRVTQQQPAVSVASVHASNTTHVDDGTNVPRPKPRRGMEKGHSSHGAKRNGPRPTPRSPESSNSRGRAEAVAFL